MPELTAIAGGARSRGGRRKGAPAGMAQPGTPEHALVLLVLAELAALFLLRRAFKSAHGG